MLSSEPKWVAVYTNPRAEKKTEQILTDSGFEVYLPLRRELHTWSDRKKWVETPLLKSYLFAKITSRQEMTLREAVGVVTLIRFRGEVATIPESEIQMMKDFINAEYEIQVRSSEQLMVGKRVRIKSGSLAGKEGMLVSGCEDGNFAVEITGISMAMVIYVDSDILEIIDDDEEQQETENKPQKEYYFR